MSTREVRDLCRKVLEYLISARRCALPETVNPAIAAVEECANVSGRHRGVVDVERDLLSDIGRREKLEQLARALSRAVPLVEAFRVEARRNNDRRFRRVDGGALGTSVHAWARWARRFMRLEALSRLDRSDD